MDFGWALRGLGLDLGTGSDLTDPPRGAFSRGGSSGRYHTALLGVAASGVDVFRDRHYVGTTRTILGEAVVTNHCLRSEELDNATWSKSQLTVSANATAAPDGATTADKLVEVATTNAHFMTQSITVTADEWIAASIYLKAGERFRGRFLFRDPTLANQVTMTVRLDTATITASSASGTGAVLSAARIVSLGNGWFRLELEGKLGGGFTTANFIWAVHDDSGNESYLGDVVKGMYAWGVQFERSGSTTVPVTCSAYIPTTSAIASKNTDLLEYYWPWTLQAGWFYAKFVELGEARVANFGDLLRLGTPGVNPSIRLMTGSGTGGSSPFWRFNWTTNGTNQSAGIANVTPAVNDTVELYGRVFANGNVELHQAINGGAATVFSGSGGFALSSTVLARRLQVFGGAKAGLIRLKAGFAPGVTTLAQARDV